MLRSRGDRDDEEVDFNGRSDLFEAGDGGADRSGHADVFGQHEGIRREEVRRSDRGRRSEATSWEYDRLS